MAGLEATELESKLAAERWHLAWERGRLTEAEMSSIRAEEHLHAERILREAREEELNSELERTTAAEQLLSE